jgi:hypothetical protein
MTSADLVLLSVVTEYEVTPPTTQNDRVCAPLTYCDPTKQYVHRKGNASKDNVCAELSLCAATSFQSKAANNSIDPDVNGTDAQCQNYSTCQAGESIFEALSNPPNVHPGRSVFLNHEEK